MFLNVTLLCGLYSKEIKSTFSGRNMGIFSACLFVPNARSLEKFSRRSFRKEKGAPKVVGGSATDMKLLACSLNDEATR